MLKLGLKAGLTHIRIVGRKSSNKIAVVGSKVDALAGKMDKAAGITHNIGRATTAVAGILNKGNMMER